jgi:hypothetical protein
MIVALVLAAIVDCVEPVYFPATLDGPVCAVARQDVECGCSECMTWDRVDDATAYEVERITNSNGTTVLVGTLDVRYDADGLDVIAIHPLVWCAVEDTLDLSQFPREGALYVYHVRACKGVGTTNCGPWSNDVLYRAAPYACYAAGGRERQCYPGDDVAAVP